MWFTTKINFPKLKKRKSKSRKQSHRIHIRNIKYPFEFIVIHDSLDLFLSISFINPPNIDIVRFNNPIDLPLLYIRYVQHKMKLKTLNTEKSTSNRPPNFLSCLFFIIAWPKDKKKTSNEKFVWINHKNLLYYLIYDVRKF